MSLSALIDYIKNAGSKDLFDVLTDANSTLTTWFDGLGIPTVLLLIACLTVSVFVGFLGYKLIKLVMAVGFAYFGFFAGMEVYHLINDKLIEMPKLVGYIIGAVLAVLFLIVAFKKVSYALFALSVLLGYCVVLFYTGNMIIALGGGILYAILSVSLVRVVFILMSSFLCGALTVNFISLILPSLGFMQLATGNLIALIVAGVFAVMYALVQFTTNPKSVTSGN